MERIDFITSGTDNIEYKKGFFTGYNVALKEILAITKLKLKTIKKLKRKLK